MIPTLEEFFPEFQALHYPRIEENTREQYTYIITKYLIPAFKNKRLDEITEKDVAILFHAYADKPYMGNMIMRVLRKVYSVAHEKSMNGATLFNEQTFIYSKLFCTKKTPSLVTCCVGTTNYSVRHVTSICPVQQYISYIIQLYNIGK